MEMRAWIVSEEVMPWIRMLRRAGEDLEVMTTEQLTEAHVLLRLIDSPIIPALEEELRRRRE